MQLEALLEQVKTGSLSVEEAAKALKAAPFADLDYAKVDLHRQLRQGVSEVIYGAGKTPEQITGIVRALEANGQDRVLVTRLDQAKAGPGAPAICPWPRRLR